MSDELFTRDEVLGGLQGKRAKALLFLIEYWAVRITQRDKDIVGAAMTLTPEMIQCIPVLLDDSLLTASVEHDPDAGFFEAFGLSKEGLKPVTLQQIEATAVSWQKLVPDNPRLKATTLHLMGQKYPLIKRRVSRILRVFGAETEQVTSAYQKMYRQPLESLFKPEEGFFQRLKGMFRKS